LIILDIKLTSSMKHEELEEEGGELTFLLVQTVGDAPSLQIVYVTFCALAGVSVNASVGSRTVRKS
jgi:hypothetical protein